MKTGGPGLGGEIVVRDRMTFKRQGHHTENRILYSVHRYMSSVGEILCGKEYTQGAGETQTIGHETIGATFLWGPHIVSR